MRRIRQHNEGTGIFTELDKVNQRKLRRDKKAKERNHMKNETKRKY